MATQKRPIIEIKGWEKGVAQTPYIGLSVLANLDVSKNGAIIMNNKAIATASALDGLPKWVSEYNNTFFLLTDTGKVYTSTDNGITWTILNGNDLTRASGNGMAVYDGFLYIARNTFLDRYNLITGSWSNSYQTLNLGALGTLHPMLVGQDDILYIANGQNLASFQSGTSTWSPNALDLPSGYLITCLSELGTDLLLGTIKNTQDRADIFPWDRVSPSFNLPIRIGEAGVYQMITKDNLVYVVCGNEYTIYETNGTTANKIISISDFLRPLSEVYNPHFSLQSITNLLNNRGNYDASVNTFPTTGGSGTAGSIMINDEWVVSVTGTVGGVVVSPGDILVALTNTPAQVSANWNIIGSSSIVTNPVSFYPGAITTFKNKIYFGVNVQAMTSTSDTGRYPFGIWSYDGVKFQLENLLSTGAINITTNGMEIGVIFPTTDSSYIYSWKNNTTTGLDIVSTKGYFHSNYEPFFESELTRIGTKKVPFTFQECEILFGKKLSTGQGLKLKYRTDLGSSWSNLATIDFATKGAINSTYVSFAKQTDTIQIRGEFTTNGNDISCPELLAIRLE